jgi:glycosyltransferase involved in cell wall biosynthesis
MNLVDFITIVIPCKNESQIVVAALDLLNSQKNIDGIGVIVADDSNDGTKEILESKNSYRFNLSVIKGGLPGKARNSGAKNVSSPYVLFMDADIFVLDLDLLSECVQLMINKDLDLLTTRVRTTNGRYNYVFLFFDLVQKLIKPFTPFCLGGFMLFKTKTFNDLGGFDEDAKVAEDYLLSKKVSNSKFGILNKNVFTLPRRFENKGIWYMLGLMFKSYFNRNNKRFFSEHKTYWK